MRRRGKLGVGVALAWLGGMLYYVQINKQRVRYVYCVDTLYTVFFHVKGTVSGDKSSILINLGCESLERRRELSEILREIERVMRELREIEKS